MRFIVLLLLHLNNAVSSYLICQNISENISINAKCHCCSYYLLEKLKYVTAVLKPFIMTSGSSFFDFRTFHLTYKRHLVGPWSAIIARFVHSFSPSVMFCSQLRFHVFHWSAVLTWSNRFSIRSAFILCFQL